MYLRLDKDKVMTEEREEAILDIMNMQIIKMETSTKIKRVRRIKDR